MPKTGTTARYRHLGNFSNLVDAVRRGRPLCPTARPGRRTQQQFLRTLNFAPGPDRPRAVRVHQRWEREGIAGEAVSWSTGYGPRTEAWVLRPAGAKGRLPGVLALHDHGGFKYFGKEKIADGPGKTAGVLHAYRREYYGGRAWANALALEGYVVLVPDVFLWGSRKFPWSVMATALGQDPAAVDDGQPNPASEQIGRYNDLAVHFEHVVEKYLTLLGTTLSGVMSFEDRVAAAYLGDRRDVCPGGLACMGLSGGGLRTTLLQATCPRIRAAVVVGLMCTYEAELDHNIVNHTWACFPRGWTAHGDWPDIAACRAPSPLMVQYDIHDLLFTEAGQRAAHRKLRAHYRTAGAPANYVGKFYPGPHKFDLNMQRDAFAWLRRQTKPAG